MDESAGGLSSVDDYAHLPLVTITGAVYPEGASGTRPSNAPSWTIDFPMAAWRIENGNVRTDRLLVVRPVDDSELVAFLEKVEPNTVVKIRARVQEHVDGSTPHALLEEYLGVDRNDVDVHAQLLELQRPTQLSDEFFGPLQFDAFANWYTTTTDWYGTRVLLRVVGSAEVDINRALQNARRIWNQSGLEQQVRLRASKILLGTKNSQWLEQGEAPLSEEQFMHRMILTAITVDPDGAYVFVFNDNNLFWGQRIHVSGTISNGPTSATL
jgi:hypothetical protein